MKKAFRHLIAATAAAFMLASCGGAPAPEHVHTFADEWTSDAETHWHEATCGHDVKGDEDVHTFGEWNETKPATETEKGSKERTCTICGYKEVQDIPVVEHVHTFATTWESDENTHWHPATCGHDVKGSEDAHSFGNWEVKTAATATEDGVEHKVCSVCGYELTRPIWHHEFKIDYSFASTEIYTVTDVEDGVRITATKTGEASTGYDRLQPDISTKKVDEATAYTFVIRNNNTESKAEIRANYRNHSTKAFAISSSPEDHSIVSLNGSSSTEVGTYKDGYIKFTIAASDTAKLTVALANGDYDQLLLMLVHSTMDLDITIIQTGYEISEHHYEEGWHSDDTHHWKECTDEGCHFISQKGTHTWVKDESKTDVPATETESGVEYKVCSVCGHTKEIVIPPTSETADEYLRVANIADVNGGLTAEDIDNTAQGNGIKLTSKGAINPYTRIFSLVLDKTYSFAKSKTAGAKFSFFVKYDGVTYTTSQTNLKKGFTFQLCNLDTSSANRASSEGRSDKAGCSATILEDNWMKIEIAFEGFDAGATDSFDRINIKIGEAGRIEYTAADQFLIFTGFESSGFAE